MQLGGPWSYAKLQICKRRLHMHHEYFWFSNSSPDQIIEHDPCKMLSCSFKCIAIQSKCILNEKFYEFTQKNVTGFKAIYMSMFYRVKCYIHAYHRPLNRRVWRGAFKSTAFRICYYKRTLQQPKQLIAGRNEWQQSLKPRAS